MDKKIPRHFFRAVTEQGERRVLWGIVHIVKRRNSFFFFLVEITFVTEKKKEPQNFFSSLFPTQSLKISKRNEKKDKRSREYKLNIEEDFETFLRKFPQIT